MRHEVMLLHSLWFGHACLISESLEQSWYVLLSSPCFSLEALWQVFKGRTCNPGLLDSRFESRSPRKYNFKHTKSPCISSPSAYGTQVKASLSCPSSLGSFSSLLGVHEVIHFKQWGSRTKQFSKETKTVYIWFSFPFSSIW